jgi:hypothetical protein
MKSFALSVLSFSTACFAAPAADVPSPIQNLRRQGATLSYNNGGSWTMNSELPVETLTNGWRISAFGGAEKRQDQTITFGGGEGSPIQTGPTLTFSDGGGSFTQSDLPVMTDTSSWGVITFLKEKRQVQTLSWGDGGGGWTSDALPVETNGWGTLTLRAASQDDEHSSTRSVITPPLTRTSTKSGARTTTYRRTTTSDDDDEWNTDDNKKRQASFTSNNLPVVTDTTGLGILTLEKRIKGRQEKTVTVTLTISDDDDDPGDEETSISNPVTPIQTIHTTSAPPVSTDIPIQTVIVTGTVVDPLKSSDFITVTLGELSKTQTDIPLSEITLKGTGSVGLIGSSETTGLQPVTLSDFPSKSWTWSFRPTLSSTGTGSFGFATETKTTIGGTTLTGTGILGPVTLAVKGGWVEERRVEVLSVSDGGKDDADETFVFGPPGSEETMVFRGGDKVTLIERAVETEASEKR